MNKSFAPESIVQDVLADACVSISDFKRNPAAIIAEAKLRQVAILNRNKPVAYVIAPHVWEYLCDLVADQHLIREAQEALEGPGENVVIDLDRYL
ncbi:MAG: type II toxin-antitoxin system Phd/YefM family antitoxin [Novosphingobium sp.]